MDVFKAPATPRDVLVLACKFLRNVGLNGDEDALQTMYDADSLVTSARASLTRDPELAELCVAGLVPLASTDERSRALMVMGAGELAVTSLTTRSSAAAASLVTNLAAVKENRAALSRRASPWVARVLAARGVEMSVAETCLKSLANLSLDEDAKETLCSVAAIPLVDALTMHGAKSVRVASGGCVTVSNLATLPSNRASLVDTGAFVAVVNALRAFGPSDTLTAAFCCGDEVDPSMTRSTPSCRP